MFKAVIQALSLGFSVLITEYYAILIWRKRSRECLEFTEITADSRNQLFFKVVLQSVRKNTHTHTPLQSHS